jgi:hypothetical protein
VRLQLLPVLVQYEDLGHQRHGSLRFVFLRTTVTVPLGNLRNLWTFMIRPDRTSLILEDIQRALIQSRTSVADRMRPLTESVRLSESVRTRKIDMSDVPDAQ